MNKNIISFIETNCNNFYLSDLIERIVGVFVYAFALVFFIEITSPFGFNGVSFFSALSLPYTCTLIIFATILSIVMFLFYKKKNKCSLFLIDAVMTLYFSISLLIASFVEFDGYSIFFQDIIFVFIKISIFLLCLTGYLILLIKKIIPTASKHKSANNYKYVFIGPSFLICATSIMKSLDYVDVGALFSTMMYLISVILIMYAVDMFFKAYYAKIYQNILK